MATALIQLSEQTSLVDRLWCHDMISLTSLWVDALLIAFLSCGTCSAADAVLNLALLTTRAKLDRADIVVVGKVARIDVSGDVVEANNGVRLQLWRIVLDPELFLKGKASGSVEYDFYNYTPQIVQNGDFERLSKGDRRIFFLAYDGQELRAVADLYVTTIAVKRSGTPDLRGYTDATVGESIARFPLSCKG